MSAVLDFDRAVAKLLRWAQKRDSFTQQQAWQANKGGSIRTSADLKTVLGFLVDNHLLVASPAETGRRTVFYVLAVTVSQELERVEPGGMTAITAPVTLTHSAAPSSGANLATVTPISAANKEPLTAQELGEVRSWSGNHPHRPRSRMILLAALERMGHGFGLTDLRPSHFTVAEAIELQRMARGS